MPNNLDIIRSTYEGPSEENGRNLLAVLAPDASWTEAAGFPYAGTYIGPEAIVVGVFKRLATEWDGYQARSTPTWPMATGSPPSASTRAPTGRRARP